MQVKLNQITRVCRGQTHNAFGDMVVFNNRKLICYRAGSGHMSEDGKIVIAEINQRGCAIRFQQLSLANTDLRDPHFCLDSCNRLFILAHQRWTQKSKQAKTYSWFTSDGLSWSSIHDPGPKGWWLWRATKYQGQHWGLAYLRQADRIDLYAGHLQKSMRLFQTAVLSKRHQNLGYPNESDCFFTAQGEMVALVRRDADSFSAQLGTAAAPYTRWKWQDLGLYIGGPAMLPLDSKRAIVAGRHFTGKNMVTQLWVLNYRLATMKPLLTLPSGGDNSYPGLCMTNNKLYVSYYSSHIDQQARMYLATLDIIE